MKTFAALLVLTFLGSELTVQAQDSIPFRPYIVAGKLKNPQRTSKPNYVVMQETVPGFPIEYDLLLYSMNEDRYFNITDDRKSTLNVGNSTLAVDPNGNWLLFYSFRQRKNSIFIKNIWTGEQITVTENGDPYFMCAWSPDGNKILFGEESGLINTPNTSVKVFYVDSRRSEEFIITENEEYTIIRGHSVVTWALNGNGFYYSTFLRKDGDYIFFYDLQKKTLRKVVKGTHPRMNLATGELLYVNNGVLMGYSEKNRNSRVVFDDFPIEKDEESTFDISPDGEKVVVSAKVGEFASGTNRNSLFVIDVNSQSFKQISIEAKSLGFPMFISPRELVFQIKGLVQIGREQVYALENKLYKSDLEGRTVQQLFNWD